jgi:pimeloyl-ACP methyl ester carboxylesterase
VRIVTDDGVRLEVADRGRGPALVLVHGFGGAKEDFADHVEVLARDHRVIAFDLRGHGESDGPDDEARYSLDRFAADLTNVVDELDLSTFRLLGHSMGGMIVRRFVSARPERVEALVLMDTSPGPVPGMDAELIDLGVQIAKEQGMDELKRVMDAFSPLGTPAYERTLVDRPGYREFNDRKWERLSPAMYTKMLVEVRDQPDELDALRAVTCPTLVMVGVQDKPFAAVSEAMAEVIADARCEVIPDAGHSPQFENPPVWLATLRGFLAEVDTRTPAA